MAQCSQCQNEIPEGNQQCNYCGHKLNQSEQGAKAVEEFSFNNANKIVIGALVFLGLIGLIVGLVASRFENAREISGLLDSVEISCLASSECDLPMDYAVRSNCPYQAYCFKTQCVVGCPMTKSVDSTFFANVYPCQTDDDCDCSDWDSQSQYDCVCLDSQCVAVVDLIEE